MMSLRNRGLSILAIFAVACSHDTAGPGASRVAASPAHVSNSQSAALAATVGATTHSAAQPNLRASRSISVTPDDATVAYISLEPQTAPTGATAVITNARTGTSLTTSMVDGGFDPVALPAMEGDSVTIDIRASGEITVATLVSTVPKRRPPKIVRTIPGRGKTGVPLNQTIEVVFTEPVTQNSLAGSIQLVHAGVQVAGAAEILEGVTAAVVFKPTAELEPNTDYDLVINNGVHDLDGDALDSAVTVPFTTGTATEGPMATLSLIPNAADVRTGDQIQVVVVAKDANGDVLTGLPITWWYEDSTIAAVTRTGLITARHEGEAAVLAEVDGYFVALIVYVSDSLRPAGSVVVSFDSASVVPGGTLRVSAMAKDADGNLLLNRVAQWTSSSPEVATVSVASRDQSLESDMNYARLGGEFVSPQAMYRADVTGISNGVTRIIATIDGRSDTIVVTVANSPPIVAFTLSRDTATLLLHETAQFSGSSVNFGGLRTPVPAADVQWETSNPAVASVDAAGIVSAGQAGTAVITGRWNNYSSSTRVTVIEIAFKTLSAGRTHACALTAGGATYCWGANDFGQAGRPGLVGYGSFSLPARIFYAAPTPVVEGLNFAAVTVGGFHSCGLTADGAAYCWGFNGFGALGSGAYGDSWRPVAVGGGLTFKSIDAGTHHTCALTAAGNAYCWGSNSSGQLGSSGVKTSAQPLLVSGGIAFTSLSAGGAHTCALTVDGVAYCWGENAGGQLGVGENVGSSATPIPVGGGLIFASLSAGESHTCGITRGGSLYCWGWNLENQLGDGILSTPSAVPSGVAGITDVIGVGAGTSHSCAIDAAGAAYCWGQNLHGETGNGSMTSDLFATPQRVGGSVAFQRLSAGRSHTCAEAVDGTWVCWGRNESGVLGTGNTTDSASPLKILGQR
jgi:alpha-tubulin suppressor-like RCC1 family protein